MVKARTASRTTVSVLSVGVLASGFLGLAESPASAQPAPKVTICHAAGGKFVSITVSSNAVNFNGHGGHGGDIIPPINGFPGLSWDERGSTAYANGCRPLPQALADTDRDGVADLRDPDDDNDGITDVSDSDDDGDGLGDVRDPDQPLKQDLDEDRIPDALDRDDDGDGVDDAVDLDADGDDVPDTNDRDVRPATDTDGDAIPDAVDADDDGDCIADVKDDDRDGDAVEDADDPDLDNDGVDNVEDVDADGDGVPNVLDADADGDGTVEALRTEDVQPAADEPSGVELEARVGTCAIEPTTYGRTDTDGDTIPNVVDADDDNDGTPDASDADQDGDGVDDTRDRDADGNGQPETVPQVIATSVALPAELPSEGETVLIPRLATTDAGQPLSLQASCVPRLVSRVGVLGDVPARRTRTCSISKVDGAYVLTTDVDAPTTVRIRISAPAVGDRVAYANVLEFDVD